MSKLFTTLKHYLIPHRGNKYKPGVFAKSSVLAIVLVLSFVEGVYVFGTPLVIERTTFTATVLPAALMQMTNTDRTAVGAGALVPDALLSQAAQKKADDMAAKGYFAHVSPEGKSPWYWLDKVGYQYTYAGENLAVDFTDSADIETAWMNSPAHHANIIKPQYTQIGIGIAQGIYEGRETTFVVELFAALPAKVTAAAHAAAPTRTSMSAPAGPEEGSRVLGEQTTPPAAGGGGLAAAVSSPNHTLTSILGVFAALVALLLALAMLVKKQKRKHYIEVVAGGAVLVGVALGIIFLNSATIPAVQLPHDSQAASVALTRVQ